MKRDIKELEKGMERELKGKRKGRKRDWKGNGKGMEGEKKERKSWENSILNFQLNFHLSKKRISTFSEISSVKRN